jgi:hypothetical protein
MSTRDIHIRYYAAVEQSDGSYLLDNDIKAWYDDAGDYHREDGPACIFSNGTVRWYIHANRYHQYDDWITALNISDEFNMLLKLQYA